MSPPAPSGADGPAGPVRERRRPGPEDAFPTRVLPSWTDRFEGLAAGITLRGTGPDGAPADFGLTTAPSAWALHVRLERLAAQLGFPGVAVARQVHGAALVCLEATAEGGVRVPGEADGLLTSDEGLLLVVTAADCVPVYLLDPASGGLGLLHAGWRGVAAGVLAAGLRAMRARFGSPAERLLLHLGPAICGGCYEVGPEVVEALGGRGGAPAGHADLGAVLADRAAGRGVRPDRTSRSAWCTRCAADQFHSHRGKGEDAGRMAAFVGWRSRPVRAATR